VDELRRSFDPGPRIRIDVVTDDLRLPLGVAMPTGMIINELVSNILKYAYPRDTQGRATVDIRQDGDRVVLRVDDDGVGFPADFDNGSRRSFGWDLVSRLVTQLDGSLETSSDGGAHVTIAFRRPNAPFEGSA
jgi:two-component sensor histidine kinase